MPIRNNHEKQVVIPRYHMVIAQALSLLMVAATLGIFTYHFTTFSGTNIKGIFLLSIYTFCFLSSYLAFTVNIQPLNWLLKRIYSIMIPYW